MLSGGADTESAASGEPHEIPLAGESSAKQELGLGETAAGSHGNI